MGGDVTVESEVGAGTTFLGLSPAAAASPRERSAGPRDRPSGRRARLLVIDDEAMIGTMLTRSSAKPTRSASPRAPKRRSLESPRRALRPHPLRHDGLSRAAWMFTQRSRRFPRAGAEMIFLTGGASTARARRSSSDRARLVVNKPFAVDELLSQIALALETLGAAAALVGDWRSTVIRRSLHLGQRASDPASHAKAAERLAASGRSEPGGDSLAGDARGPGGRVADCDLHGGRSLAYQ